MLPGVIEVDTGSKAEVPEIAITYVASPEGKATEYTAAYPGGGKSLTDPLGS
jgi:hypothetical protein